MAGDAVSDKRPVGRPSEYDPSFCERVIDLGKDGLSPAEIAAELGHPRTTMLLWGDTHPEFLTALQHARDLSLAWWEKQAREGLEKGAAFNAGLWKHAISGRFPTEPYRERVQVTGPNDGPVKVDLSGLTDEELTALEAIRSKLAIAGSDQGGEGPAGG